MLEPTSEMARRPAGSRFNWLQISPGVVKQSSGSTETLGQIAQPERVMWSPAAEKTLPPAESEVFESHEKATSGACGLSMRTAAPVFLPH